MFACLFCLLLTPALSQYVPPSHRILTIDYDAAYVTSKVGNIAVAGTSREGRALVLALETDVRAALSPTATSGTAVGLQINIDGNSINGIQLHKRIAMRPFRYLGGSTCETTCGFSTGNNETCPVVTYLKIRGIPHANTNALPTIKQIEGSNAYGLFHVDTNPTYGTDNNCGVTYEPGNHSGTSSTTVVLALSNVVLSHNTRLPAVHVTTLKMVGSSASSTLRSTLVLLSRVVFDQNAHVALDIVSKHAPVHVQMNATHFTSNRGHGALNIQSDGTTDLNVNVNNCTFENNQATVAGSGTRFLSTGLPKHALTITSSTYRNNTVRPTGNDQSDDCQLWIRTDSTSASKSIVSPLHQEAAMFVPVLPSLCVANTITTCLKGESVDNIGQCVPCAAGSYSVGGNDAVCTMCSAGQYTATSNSATCTKCDAGQTSRGGQGGIVGAGSSRTAAGSTSCIECEKGKYSTATDSTTCKLCPPGHHASSVGSSSCVLCETGKYDSNSNVGGSAECTACGVGTFSDSTGALSCSSCQVGTYASTVGLTACALCHRGTYADGVKSTACKTCNANANMYIKTKDGLVNQTGLGGVECVRLQDNSPSAATDGMDVTLIIVLSLSITFIVVVSVVMTIWVCRSRKRRRARMVNPNFPAAESVELTGQHEEITPASIINRQFQSHDLDHDGHIDGNELTNLIREIIGMENGSEDAFVQISSILLNSSGIDSDGNGSLEKDEFTMLCLRVMRWPSHDVDVRLKRMVPNCTREEMELLKYFFSHMNRWFMRKLAELRRTEVGSQGGSFDPAEEHSRRQAEHAVANGGGSPLPGRVQT